MSTGDPTQPTPTTSATISPPPQKRQWSTESRFQCAYCHGKMLHTERKHSESLGILYDKELAAIYGRSRAPKAQEATTLEIVIHQLEQRIATLEIGYRTILDVLDRLETHHAES